MADRILVIGNKNYSSWSLRAWFWLTHTGLAFEERRVPLFTAETDATLAPYFSDCKVPVLVEGERTIWDSLAILEYLAERVPDAHPWPEDVSARALARSACAEMHSSFFSLRNELPMNCRASCPDFVVSEGTQREVRRIQALWRACREHAADQGPYLFGRLSLADAMFAPVVFRFHTYGVDLADDSAAYCEAMLSHPIMMAWKADAEREVEVIEAEEVCG